MDYLLVFGKECGGFYCSVAHSCAYEYHGIALVDRTVCGLYSVHTQHSQIKGVICGEEAEAHHC